MRLLLVEDEPKMASFISKGLREEHYAVDVAKDGEEALFLAGGVPYDLIILDLMLPDTDGLSVCRTLRGKKIDAPILIITARDSIRDKVTGLDVGADDYLTKPFSFEEFLARVRALLRRKRSGATAALRVADLELDQLTRGVKRGGRTIELTSKEYALLEYFMLNTGEVITRTMISEHVWNEDYDSFTNIIDVYVNRLRKKIENDRAKPLIHTVHGAGYVLRG